jgi:hypothetical protein
MNVVSSSFEIIASLADMALVWVEYNRSRCLIEKELTVGQILAGGDNEWVYDDVHGSMDFEAIAQKVEREDKNVNRDRPSFKAVP